MNAELKEWMVQFVKNKDAFFKKIASIEDAPDGALITYKDDSKERIIVDYELRDLPQWISTITEEDKIVVVIANSKKNRQNLMTHWQELITFKKLCVYAVNPNASAEKKWIVCPHTHNKICDTDKLKSGLDALAESVDDL